jgi:AcrR family transcriptional regulator
VVTQQKPSKSATRAKSSRRVYRAPRQARARETVDALLVAAKTLLVRSGVQGATTNAIAELAGVSIGSLYQYFPSREAIIAELSRRHVARVLSLIFAEVDALVGTSLRVGARRLIQLMIDVHRQDPELHAAIEASHPRLGARALLAEVEAQVMATARTYLHSHREELVVDDLDRASFIVVTAIEALTHEAAFRRPDLLDREALVDDITRLVLGYLTGQP